MIREIDESRLDDAIAHYARVWAEPDDVHARPFSSDMPFDREGRVERCRTGWAKRLDEVGWLRTWALVIDGAIRGHLDLRGGQIASELHRATIGIAIEGPHRGAGHGRALLAATIEWARANRLAWLDLGVFSENARAIALYRKLGFVELGVTRDRFRVDGRSIHDIAMTLAL